MPRRILVALLCLALIAGCASVPTADTPGAQAASRALELVGAPYRFGGADPASGFDCSGLVQWSFRQAGMAVPRSTAEQRLAATPVPAADLRPGDLLFFDLQGQRYSHVGLYAGDGTFVHAPSTGKAVRRDRLDSPFWRKQLSEFRRLGL